MILKLTLDLFKEHIYIFSDLKNTPWAHGNQGGGQGRKGGICCLLPPTFETMFHSIPSERSSSSCETQLQEYHKGSREIGIRIFTILPILHILPNVTISPVPQELVLQKAFCNIFS